MRRLLTAAFFAIATVLGAVASAHAQGGAPLPPPPLQITRPLPPLGIYALGSIGCAAAAPMVQTLMLGRELTLNEAYRTTFGCFAGPAGWLVADWLAPPGVGLPGAPTPPGQRPRRPPGQRLGNRNVSIPPPGLTAFVPDEILLQLSPGVAPQAFARTAGLLQITLLETQTFALTGRTLTRWRITGNRSVTRTLRSATQFSSIASAQPNYLYALQQGPAQATKDQTSAQYVVSKLHLNEAHRITSGDDVLVAVIDSKVDAAHADLAGVVADELDLVGGAAPAHSHGTAMAGAIAAHSKLLGVAPKVKLLVVRAFSGSGDSAQATTFNVLKGLDWAASKNARVVNMSFAGPSDSLLRDMLDKASAHGMVLIAAVGNAGPKSPPLYPAADAHVIGITATDAQDKLLPQANRGAQVAVAAPGVDVMVVAPDGAYTLTSGTSVAAAHVSGVAALLLARDAKLTPAQVRGTLIRTAHPIAGNKTDYGAGVIDALSAVNTLPH